MKKFATSNGIDSATTDQFNFNWTIFDTETIIIENQMVMITILEIRFQTYIINSITKRYYNMFRA